MIVKPSTVINVAKAEVGYHEKASNKNLDSKTANSGSANWTKYARDLHNAGYYNGNKNGYEWCDVCTDWFFYTACGKDKKKAEAMQCQTGNLGAGTLYSMNYYKAQNRFDKNPQKGDQIFFLYSGTTGCDHTGLVIDVTSSQIKTIEGNSNNQVQECTYSRSYYAILGYGHPKYDAYDEESKKEENKKEDKGVKTVNIEMPVIKLGDKGEEVKTLQRLLKQLDWRDESGAVISVDGSFGKKTDETVRRYQKKKLGSADGIVGAKTWTRLLKGV